MEPGTQSVKDSIHLSFSSTMDIIRLKLMVLGLLAAVCNVCTAQILLISTGMTVVLNDIPYYIPASPVATIQIRPNQIIAGSSAAGLVPLTVVETTSLTFNQSDLAAIIANYTASDDVFQAGFLEGIATFIQL